MKEHEILAAVEQTAKFDDHEHARRAVQATLSVLGEVAVREGGDCSPIRARQHARAVMSALRSGVTPGEFDDVVQQLPNEYADLLGSPPVLH